MQSVVFGSSHLPDKTRKRRSSLQFVMAQSNDLIWPPHWSSWCYSLPHATAFEAARSMLFIIELFSCLCTERATTMYYMRGRRRRRWGPWCQLPYGPSMMDYWDTSGNLRKPAEEVSGRFPEVSSRFPDNPWLTDHTVALSHPGKDAFMTAPPLSAAKMVFFCGKGQVEACWGRTTCHRHRYDPL